MLGGGILQSDASEGPRRSTINHVPQNWRTKVGHPCTYLPPRKRWIGYVRVRACLDACVRACVRARARACACACGEYVRSCMHAHVSACMHTSIRARVHGVHAKSMLLDTSLNPENQVHRERESRKGANALKSRDAECDSAQ